MNPKVVSPTDTLRERRPIEVKHDRTPFHREPRSPSPSPRTSPEPAPASPHVLPPGEQPYNVANDPNIRLTPPVRNLMNQLGMDFYAGTGRKLTVTSGTRGPRAQADAMHTKLKNNDKLTYKDKTSYKQIKAAYEKGVKAKKSASEIQEAMAHVISEQIGTGKYISAHLREGAVDLRSHDAKGRAIYSASELNRLRSIVTGMDGQMLIEKVPRHIHIQFPVEKKDSPNQAAP